MIPYQNQAHSLLFQKNTRKTPMTRKYKLFIDSTMRCCQCEPSRLLSIAPRSHLIAETSLGESSRPSHKHFRASRPQHQARPFSFLRKYPSRVWVSINTVHRRGLKNAPEAQAGVVNPEKIRSSLQGILSRD